MIIAESKFTNTTQTLIFFNKNSEKQNKTKKNMLNCESIS